MPGSGGSAWFGGVAGPRGVPGPRGVYSRGEGGIGAWSSGVLGPGGVCSRGTPGLGGAWWRPPRRLLLWAVRILLECILVFFVNATAFFNRMQ